MKPVIIVGEGELLEKIVFKLTLVILLITALTFKFPSVEAESTWVYVSPQNNLFDTETTPLFTRFNITIWVQDVEDLAAWQVRIYYNDTFINVTRWFEPAWNASYVFYGKSTLPVPTPPNPNYGHDPTRELGYAECASALFPFPGQPTFTGTGLLCIFEFEITAKPRRGETYSCDLSIDNKDTFLLNSYNEEISGVIKENGYYEYFHVPTPLIIVPDDYPTIQEAVNVAIEGDTIFVRAGMYYEQVDIATNNLTLIGENKETTMIDGEYHMDSVINVTANNIYISGFTIQHCGSDYPYAGISILQSCNVTVRDNILKENYNNIYLCNSNQNIIAKNLITNASATGVLLENCKSNILYHNNFINNTIQVNSSNSISIWDNSYEGNYWSNYAGSDMDGDGIGDTPYVIDSENMDSYPLMNPYMVGDVNHDAKVNMKDLYIVILAFGSSPGDDNWNGHADINEDGKVNMKDIYTVILHFGEQWI